MLRKLLPLALLCTALFLCGFGGPQLVDRPIAPTQRLSTGDLRQIVQSRTLPEVSANALLVYDIDAGRLLYERDSNVALPPASLTKLMTALLVLEADNLDEIISVQPSDLIGDASMGLAAGEEVAVETLLWGLLLPSGNDAAMALARHTAGSVEAFVAQMNRRAAELGLAESNFQNPHGLDADNHTSSARDLLTLTLAGLDYPLFREIVATPEAIVDGYPLQNTNQLLADFEGATGVKTGTTPAAGECLVAQIERGGHPVLIIVLGSDNRYADARALHNLYQLNYRWTGGQALPALNRLIEPLTLMEDGADVANSNGGAAGEADNAAVITETGAADVASDRKLWYLRAQGQAPQTLARRWQSIPLRPHHVIEPPAAGVPWRAGATVGRMLWYAGDEVVGSQELVLR